MVCVARRSAQKRQVRALSPFWRRKITVISLNCQLFICYFVLFSFHKPVLPPPILICVNPLVLFVHQTWNGNNAILMGKAFSLLPSSPRVFCPLLSYSLSSVSLRDFFGVAHLITVAGQATSSYRNVLLLFFLVTAKLERAQFYAWLIGFSPFSCDRFLFALGFLFNMRFCENEPLKSWWNLDFDVALS